MMIKTNKALMLKAIQSLIIIALFTTCKSISYESAKHSNEDKFYGDKEENALMLVEMKNLSQLAEDLSGLTEEKAYTKDVYDFGLTAIKDHKKFQSQMAILAFKKRIKLPSSVKQENQEVYRSIHKVSDRKTFDRMYMEEMKKILKTLADMSDQFLEDGQDKHIRNLITKHSGAFKSEIKHIENMQEYMEKPAPEITSRDK
jgi:predicted outer membrane protein